MQVTLSERAAELAAMAVQRGLYATVEAAVEHALVLLALGAPDDDDIPEWDAEYAAEVNRKLDEAEEDIRAGRVVVIDEAYRAAIAERVRAMGRPRASSG
jgi:glutathione S-transferase